MPEGLSKQPKLWEYGVSFILILIPFILAAQFTDILDNPFLAFDWKRSFSGAIWTQDFGWGSRGLFTPPWSVWLVLPFTAFPLKFSWALMMTITVISFALTIPKQHFIPWLLTLFLLFTAFPVIRNFADLNLEAFVILGLLLSSYAFQQRNIPLLVLGLLLAAIKPQVSFLAIFVIGITVLKTYERQESLQVVAWGMGIFVITMVLWGEAWWLLAQGIAGSNSISLNGIFQIWDYPSILIIMMQVFIIVTTIGFAWIDKSGFHPIKIAFLVTGSLLSAPYSNGLSIAIPLAIGVTVVFKEHRILGLFIFAIYNIPYFKTIMSPHWSYIDKPYHGILQLIVWSVFLVKVYQIWKQNNQLQRT